MSRIAVLENELDLLRERFLQSVGHDDTLSFAIAERFGVTKTQAKVVAVLMKHERVTKDSLHTKIYAMREEPPDTNVLSVIVCQLRPKLRRYGISIDTGWGQGFSLSPANKRRIQEFLSDMEEA